MKRILIDLTDIEQWSGIHGGTQRVVYKLARNFYLQPPDDMEVVFVSFDADHKKFYVSSFEPVYHRVEGLGLSPAEPVQTLPIEVPTLSTRIKQKVPARLRANKHVRRLAGAKQPESVAPKRNWITFGKQDTVLILGKPWDNLDIQRTLTAERKAHKFKLVQVVYDLIICLQPHLQNPVLYEPYTQHMLEACRESDLMLPISKSSERDLKKLCDQNDIKVPQTQVVRLGDDIVDPNTMERSKPDERVAKEFLLCVGTVEIRKNHALLYYTYKLAAEKGIKMPQLIIAGSRGWLTGDVQYMIDNDPAVKDKILILDHVADGGLAWLYEHCLFTLYPSMYEGWGLPVAESLAHGKLCLSSNASSMPEIAGDLIEYFSPYSAAECLEVTSRFLDETRRAKMETAIRSSYKTTSWEDTYRQVLSHIGAK
jgi:glycosyltransferase involved in cell wall biosynthesis